MTASGDPLFEYLLRLGDNALVLGHRLSEWCGHAPALEEDIAIANTALDFIGEAQMWLGLAGEVEGEGRDADRLAYHRDVWDFRNLLLVEQPNGYGSAREFGVMIVRQYLYDQCHVLLLDRLTQSSNERIAAIAEKTIREARYHLGRSSEMVIALGDGSAESHDRISNALTRLWPFVGEMLIADAVDEAMAESEIGPNPESLRDDYHAAVRATLTEATLDAPEGDFAHRGGKDGVRHTEHLGHMLTQMQWLQRAYPDARW